MSDALSRQQRGIGDEALAAATTQNFFRLFKIAA